MLPRLLFTALLTLLLGTAQAREIPNQPPLPQFSNSNPAHWFNSAPLRREDLRGKVLLLDIWTYDCWNCYRSFPWLHKLEERFADADFQVIGIHTPEFKHEKEPDRVASAFSLGPRVIISREGLTAAELVKRGSRIRGPEGPGRRGWHVRSSRHARPVGRP